ncbi:MAG: hypothetical protein R3E65_10080 [Steroidobacteraceae bacterium]
MKFDPSRAASNYAEMPTDDLVRIAFIDGGYLDEAKDLAKAELSRRGVGPVTKSDLARVERVFEERQIARLENDYAGLEKIERFKSSFATVAFIAGSWVLLPIIPHADFDLWAVAVLMGWGVFTLIAVADSRQGETEKLIYGVLIPLGLLLISLMVRFVPVLVR